MEELEKVSDMDGKGISEMHQFHDPIMEEDKKQIVSGKITDQNKWIPEEILFCILPNLPGKSLMRFKCVNKSWDFMISDSNFIGKTPKLILHVLNSLFLMDYEDPMKIRKLDLPTKPNSRGLVNIRASCNGILWIAVDHLDILWNPFTGEHKIMPIIQSHFLELFKDQPYLRGIFDIFEAYGFGYDHTTKDYKIICIPGRYRYHYLKPFIYSVKNDSCEIIEKHIPWYLSMTFYSKKKNGISMKNGSFCYWPIVYDCCYYPGNNSTCPFCLNYVEDLIREPHPLILGFDLVNRRQVLVPQPPGRVSVSILIDFEGSLCAVQELDYVVEMWLLKEDWVKLMSIDMGRLGFMARPIHITKDEAVLMICILDGRKKRILVYAPQNSQEMRFRYEDCKLDCWLEEIMCRETLASIG